MPAPTPRSRQLLGLIGLVLIVALIWWVADDDSNPSKSPSGPTSTVTHGSNDSAGAVALADLPAQARQTVRLIQTGALTPYPRDGITFRNAEGLLPPEPTGYYREFTVPTPGSADRGARRIVVGSAGELYYTDDHYRSFRLISVITTGQP